MRRSLLVVLPLTMVLLGAASPRADVKATRLELTLLVGDEEQVSQALVKEADTLGGYMQLRAAKRLVAKVPQARLPALMKAVEAAGLVVERRSETRDVTQERARTEAGLTSRESMLHQYLGSLRTATSREDLAQIQVATGELVGEIEQAKGLLRRLDHEAQYATVDLSFALRERTPLKSSKVSSFPWLSSVDLPLLLYGFQAEETR